MQGNERWSGKKENAPDKLTGDWLHAVTTGDWLHSVTTEQTQETETRRTLRHEEEGEG